MTTDLSAANGLRITVTVADGSMDVQLAASEANPGAIDYAYPPGEGRLPGLRWVGDRSDARTSAVKIRGGLDGDHHRR